MFIELQTTAFTRSIQCNGKTTFQLIGTLTSEEIVFEQPNGSGDWVPVVVDTEGIKLTATNTMVTVAYPALIRINKPITASNAGVQMVS